MKTCAQTVATAAACLLFATPLPAQDKATLWTKISAQGSTVILTWHKKHPWDQYLLSGGAELIAEYKTEQSGTVSELLARALPPEKERRSLTFTLPLQVRAQPAGPVCLLIQSSSLRKLLPVRRADDSNRDTARFRYQPWEMQAAKQATLRENRLRVQNAKQQLNVAEGRVADQERLVAGRDWDAACEAVYVPTAGTVVKPYDAVEPDLHDEIARRVCVYRVWRGRAEVAKRLERLRKKIAATANLAPAERQQQTFGSLHAIYTVAFAGSAPPGDLVAALMELLGPENVSYHARQNQVSEFMADWQKWSPSAGTYSPHLGSADTYLRWHSTSAITGVRLLGHSVAKSLNAEWLTAGIPKPSIEDAGSYLGAAMDAYFGCLDDGKKQLQLKYDNWIALKSSIPEHTKQKREFLVRECKQEMAKLQQLRSAVEQAETLVKGEEERLAAALSAAAPASVAAPAVLNLAACTQ